MFNTAFVVSGSTLPFEDLRVLSSVEGLTALSTSKGYRTANAMAVSIGAGAVKT
jgi:hypothetical protein